jgi:4'-phosphopantetheinyl transferase
MTYADTIWLPPPAESTLDRDEVHVWRAALDLPDGDVARLARTLAPDELQRANRFYFPRDRSHFIVGRATLRLILGRYLRVAPEQIGFAYSAYGKPSLAAPDNQELYQFNLAHSAGMALYAMARTRAVGVDIERIRDDLDHQQIAARFFSPAEQAQLQVLPAEQHALAFFHCWTRKESYIKAHGVGLSMPLDRFTVSLAPYQPAQLLHSDAPGEVSRWSLQELSPGPGYAASLTVEGSGWRLACWQWAP